jgi:hypothetical protein
VLNYIEVVRECGHALAGEGVVLHDKGTVVCMGMLIRLPSCSRANVGRGAPILNPRRIKHVPLLGRLRDQHVCSP